MRKNQRTKTGAEGIKWNLKDLYKGTGDPGIERDIKKVQRNAERFEKRYRNKIRSAKLSPQTLLRSVKELEQISESTGKLLSYAHLLFASDTNNPKHGAFLQSIQEKATGIKKKLIFFASLYLMVLSLDEMGAYLS